MHFQLDSMGTNLSPRMKHHPMIYQTLAVILLTREVLLSGFSSVNFAKLVGENSSEEFHLCIFCEYKIVYNFKSLPANETSCSSYKSKYYI